MDAYLTKLRFSLSKYLRALLLLPVLAEEPVDLPSPLQSEQTDCICCTIPGASCLIIMHLPPWLEQQTFLLSCSLVVFPLYRSSKETLQEEKGFFKSHYK
uniref:Uncharacterized protein n=1 Tax=Anolis carolinensis TaxID=28377 RepID=A0A803TY96_ANOCA